MRVERDNQRPLVVVPMSALGGGQDDWPSVIGQANALAGKGAVQLLPTNGDLLCKSAVALVSGAMLIGRRDVRILSSLANGTGFANSVLKTGVSPSGGGSTLAVAFNAVGTRVLSVVDTTDLAPGKSVGVGSGTRAMYYTVLARSVASGAGTITVERPILWKFAIGETVDVVQPNRGVQLIGNGATIAGTGDRAIELTAFHEGLVDNWRIDASAGFGAIVCNLDVGSYRSSWRRIVITGGFGAQAGLGIESAESCHATECYVDNVATLNPGFSPGIHVPDCRDCHVTRCTSTRNELGFTWNTNGGTPEDGSFWCSLSDSLIEANASHGIVAQAGSGRCRVDRCASLFNGGHGMLVGDNAPPVTVTDSELSGNVGDGINTTAGTRVFARGLVLENNATNGTQFNGDAMVSDSYAAENGVNPAAAGSNAGFAVGVAASVTFKGCTAVPFNPATLGIGFFSSSTGRTTCVGCKVVTAGSAGGTKVGYELEAAGTFDIQSSTCDAAPFGYAQQTAGAKLRRGENVDLSAAGTPYLIAAGTTNLVDVVANGAGTPQVIPMSCDASDAIAVTRTVAAGAPGIMPTVIAGALAATFTAPAGDTSTYRLKVVS